MNVNDVLNCERCGAQIVESPHRPPKPFGFTRYIDEETRETEHIKLCTMCLDDIWECVFETEVDRTDKADPIPIERLSGDVEQHIEELEAVLESLETLANDG